MDATLSASIAVWRDLQLGNVGAAAAHWAASQQLADVVLVDIAPLEGKTKGKALDLLEAFKM